MRIVKIRYLRNEQFHAIPGFIYCGREFGGFPASPLANPYKGPGAVEKYRGWLAANLHRESIKAALSRISEESVLGCWCADKDAGVAPILCHCDVIAQVWREMRIDSLADPLPR